MSETSTQRGWIGGGMGCGVKLNRMNPERAKWYSWKEAVVKAMAEHGEVWDDVEHHTLTYEQLSQKFDDSHEGPESVAFTLWTKERVYFPVVYDGAEWVDSVSRNPDGQATKHVGGWWGEYKNHANPTPKEIKLKV